MRCCLLSPKKNSITRHLFTLYGGRFSVNHDVVRIWVMLKIKGKYKQQKILIVKYRKAVFENMWGLAMRERRSFQDSAQKFSWKLIHIFLPRKVGSPTTHQWLYQLPYAVLRKSAFKFTEGSKRENSISYYFLLFWINENSISVLKTLLSCLSEKTL